MGEKAGDSRCSAIDAREIVDLHFCALNRIYGSNPTNRYANRSRTEQEGGQLVNKNELVDAVAAVTELTKADAAKAVDAVFDSITKSLKKGHEVRLVGFGTFNVRKRAASLGRNPRTGEPLKIPASKQPKFKAGKGLKDAVN
jgi:DNA-binding protein HU-beta